MDIRKILGLLFYIKTLLLNLDKVPTKCKHSHTMKMVWLSGSISGQTIFTPDKVSMKTEIIFLAMLINSYWVSERGQS